MSSIRYIADWHYGHTNILTYDKRPFQNVSDMNTTLIERWNTVVEKDGLVYILGDMFWCSEQDAVPILKSLNGQKILICGNHDQHRTAEFKKCFAAIYDYREITDQKRHVVLCHYPIICYKNMEEGWLHLYGHVHNSPEYEVVKKAAVAIREIGFSCQMYNVGCMMPWMAYTPRTLDEILSNAK